MTRRLALTSGAVFGGVSVVAGAFGAHMLKDSLTPHFLAVFETAVRYQMYHAMALLITGLAMTNGSSSVFQKSAWGFLVGILLFSGSLYGVSLSGVSWLGAITPLGGASFIFGWVCLVIGFVQEPRPVQR